jgi:hypothetical protein
MKHRLISTISTTNVEQFGLRLFIELGLVSTHLLFQVVLATAQPRFLQQTLMTACRFLPYLRGGD